MKPHALSFTKGTVAARLWVVLARIAVVFLPIAGWAQAEGTREWEALVREAGVLEAKGDFRGAAASLNKALTLARGAVSRNASATDLLAVTLNNLGSVREKQGEIREAIHHYKESIHTWHGRFRETGNGLDEIGLAKSMNNLGWLYGQISEHRQAEDLLQGSLAIKRRRLSEGSPEIVHTLINLGLAHVAQKRFDEARVLFDEAEVLARNAPGGALLLSRSLTNKGLLFFETGRRYEAITATEEGLRLLEEVVGGDHPELVRVLTNLAAMHSVTGNPATGLAQVIRAVRIAETKLGANHLHLAEALEVQALCLRGLNRTGEAKRVVEQSRRIMRSYRDANLLGHRIDWKSVK